MKTVASRDLRNHTSAVLRDVADGESVAVTVHGRVVAEIVPPRDQRPRTIPRQVLTDHLKSLRPDPQLKELLDEISGEMLDDDL